MPIYEYRCEACGKLSSALLKSWDAADPPCPFCGSAGVQRQVSRFATVRSGGSDPVGDDLGGDDFGDDGMDGSDDWGDEDY
jgi:putative FmdB family regulatory protein